MSTVNGYSSSDESVLEGSGEDYGVSKATRIVPNLIVPPQNMPTVPSIPLPECLPGVTSTFMDNAAFMIQAKRPRVHTTRAQRKKSRRDRNSRGSDPWASHLSLDDDQLADGPELSHEQSGRNDLQIDNTDPISLANERSDVLAQNSIVPDEVSGVTGHSHFTGSQQYDYLGRSYMHVPRDLAVSLTKSVGSIENYVPKKVCATFAGHSKGVTKLALFPESGHLLLSCGNDSTIRLWDMYHEREQLRIFEGHSLAVKDIVFNGSGTRFLSCGYDRKVILWDTESGVILESISTSAVPNTVCFNPNTESEFLIGLSNCNIEHYSLANGISLIQTYTHHVGAINSLTLVESGKRFMSTADDKSVRIWDWQVNIPVKCISDPVLHSMPAAAVYPDQSFIALQSMDNSVKVVQGHGKYRFSSKRFIGHRLAGYGIGIDISPDGRILCSGDSQGSAYFWDWRSTRTVARLKLDTKPITCIQIHPQETSLVVAAGMSGKIYCCR